MARKAVTSGGTRDEIISVAQRLFFEKGFDGVTIRTIQREVGCEVGLFYYYFKSKDEIFDVILDRLSAEWSEALDKASENATEDPRACLDRIFREIHNCLNSAKEKTEQLHWSVQNAMRERLTGLAASYIENILNAVSVRLMIEEKPFADMLAGAICRRLFDIADWEYRTATGQINLLLDALIGTREKLIAAGRRRDISVELL